MGSSSKVSRDLVNKCELAEREWLKVTVRGHSRRVPRAAPVLPGTEGVEGFRVAGPQGS